MEYYLSKKFTGMAPSAVREILKMMQEPNMISFAAGSPASEALPFDKIGAWVSEILSKDTAKALQYGVSEGDGDLLWLVRHKLIEENLFRHNEEIMITCGAQQGLDFAARCLCEEGDTVLCEDPTFVGALNAFRSYGLNTVGVPMESDGMDLNALEHLLKTEKRVRFLYVIPNFQNPTGVTTSFDKRRKILELAQQYNIVILEDNPYGALRFTGEDQPSIKSFDEEGRVIYLGSFSKILSPGLRVGFLVADKAYMNAIAVAKQCADVHTSGLSQQICRYFLQGTDLQEHYKNLSKIYKEKCDCMAEAMAEHFDGKIKYLVPEGGLFMWCELPKHIDMLEFCATAVQKHRVAVVPGVAFSADGNGSSHHFRVNYSVPTKEEIKTGIKALGDMV